MMHSSRQVTLRYLCALFPLIAACPGDTRAPLPPANTLAGELAADFASDLVPGLALVLGPAPVGPKITFSPTPLTDQQSGGVHFLAGTEQIDQDLDPKFVLRFPENLFQGNRTFQFFLQAPD